MKVPGVLFLVVLSASAAASQDATGILNAPGVEVISNSWRREVRNPALLEDPMVSTQNRNPDRSSKEVDQENNSRLKANRILLPDSPKDATKRSLEDPSVEYVYEVKLRNSGALTIRRIEWQFDVLEPTTQQLLGHHTFTTKTNIQHGKTTKLVERSRSRPASVIDASKAGQKSSNQFTVQVIINRIEYDRGPVWVRTAN